LYNSKGTLERTFDAILGRELRNLNAHLPKQRRTLAELLKVINPTVEAVDGSSIVLKSEELERLARLVPPELHDRLKLPMIILRRMELGKSVYTIAGERVEEYTVQKLLGEAKGGYYQTLNDQAPVFLYRPEVSELLRLFHSLFVIAFGVPKELSDYAPKRD